MAEPPSLIDNNILLTEKPNDRENPGGESTDKSPFRRIEFHLARKPFTGFTKGGGGDGSFRLETLNPTTTSSKNTHDNQQSVGLDSVGGGSSGKKRDPSELENGLDPELSFGVTFRRIGAGLENLGNTCFLNSVLQCLTYTEPLAAYLQSGKHQITCRNAGFCALCAIQKHVSRALQSSGRSLAPKDLVSNLRCISRTFRNSRQEDAHEYMVNLLESMHKCCLPKGVPSESPSAYDRSLVHKIFGGRLRSQVKCMQCNYCSNKFDPFLDLSLEILKADNLYKAFANFTAKEQLDGGAKQYQCQQCKQKVKALKQLTIHKAPNVLTIHLKRFGSHMSGQKIDKKIHFGPTLDLKPFVTGPYDGDLKYTLYGVLVHAGWSTHSGHYYCFVRTSSGMWYSLDDNRVIQVSEKKVFEQKAYMLFYFRDRKNIPLKKPADVVHQKEKMVNNVGRNNTHPIISEGKGGGNALSNGMLDCPSSSAAVCTRDALSINAPKDTQMNFGLSNGTLNGTNATKETGMKEGSVQKSVSGAQLESSLQNDTMKVNGGLSIEKSRDILKHDDAVKVESTSGVGTVVVAATPSSSNGLKSSKKEAFFAMLPECKEKRSTNGNLSASTAVTKPFTTPGDTSGIKEKTCSEKEVTGNESFGATGGDDRQKGAVAVASSEISNLPKMESSLNQKAHKKLKKNSLKCKVTSMKFSSNILMGASLNQRKKKKHKRSDKSKLRVKNLARENLMDEGPSSSDKINPQKAVKPRTDEGTSSSVKVNPFSAMNGVKPGSKIDDKKSDISVNSVEKEFKERVDKDGAVLATSLERNFNGASARSQSEVKGTDGLSDCKRTSTQKELVHMLTRGLDDRTVPRWDENESTSSQIRQTKGALSIGYVGDEWDEEYDRGKRKKVRISRTEFDGKNPFQEIANERLKSHAAKQKRLSKRPSTGKHKNFKNSSFCSRPFRI